MEKTHRGKRVVGFCVLEALKDKQLLRMLQLLQALKQTTLAMIAVELKGKESFSMTSRRQSEPRAVERVQRIPLTTIKFYVWYQL
jgi:hypothetical protein